MFAVIKTGGKQYKVAKDDVIAVEKLEGDPGATVELTDVLMVGDDKAQTTGTPLVDGATVAAEVVKQDRSAKIIVFKKKRRKDYRRTKGHRQQVTVLRITDILTDGKKPAKKAAAKKPAATEEAKPAAKTDDKPAAKPAPKKPAAKAKTDTKPAAKKPAAKKPAAKKPAAKKPAAKKPAARKPAAKKPAPKKTEE